MNPEMLFGAKLLVSMLGARRVDPGPARRRADEDAGAAASDSIGPGDRGRTEGAGGETDEEEKGGAEAPP